MKTCILRGVPVSLRRDGWWLGPITHVEMRKAPRNPPRRVLRTWRYALQSVMLAALIALAQMHFATAPAPGAPPGACAGCDKAANWDFPAPRALRSLVASSYRTVPL